MDTVFFYGTFLLGFLIPTGFCLIMAKIIGVKMNWFSFWLLPSGFVFLACAVLLKNYWLFAPSVILLWGHWHILLEIKLPKHVIYL